MYFTVNRFPMFLRTKILRLEFNSILHSSEKITCSHFVTGHDNFSRHHWSRLLRWREFKPGLLAAIRANNPFLLAVLLIVPKYMVLAKSDSWRTCLAVQVGIPFEILTTLRSICLLRMRGLPHLGRSATLLWFMNFFRTYWTEHLLILRDWAISVGDFPMLKNWTTKLRFSVESRGISDYHIKYSDLLDHFVLTSTLSLVNNTDFDILYLLFVDWIGNCNSKLSSFNAQRFLNDWYSHWFD